MIVIDDNVDDEEILTLPIHLVHEIFQYIHNDFKYIVHRCDNYDNKLLDIGIIMNSNLEDYFEDALLSFKDTLCDECAMRGQLNSLKWARSKGCPWTVINNITAEERGIESLLYIGFDVSGLALLSTQQMAEFGDFFINVEETKKEGACTLAAISGHLHIIQWAREDGCDWNLSTSLAAAEGGHLHVLQWLRENGCPWHSKIFRIAAGCGHLHILQWLLESNHDDIASTSDFESCKAAAGGGHLNILQWLRDNGYGWNSDTCTAAAGAGHLNILQWARANGCPWNSDTYHAANRNGFTEIVNWALQNGVDTA